jgi:hypothetical protein
VAFLFEICDTAEAASLLALCDSGIAPALGQLGDLAGVSIAHRKRGGRTYTLGEIDMDAVVVDQHSLHLKVGLLAVLLIFKLDKRIL